MCRDRFKQILRYFHCADQSGYIPRGEKKVMILYTKYDQSLIYYLKDLNHYISLIVSYLLMKA